MRYVKIVALLIIALAGSYSAAWYYQAMLTQDFVEKQLGKLTAASRIKGVPKWTYDKLSVGGFPMTVDVLIHNPTLEIDFAQLNALHEKRNDSTQKTSKGPSIDSINQFGAANITFGKQSRIIFDYFNQSVQMLASSDDALSATISGSPLGTLLFEMENGVKITMNMGQNIRLVPFSEKVIEKKPDVSGQDMVKDLDVVLQLGQTTLTQQPHGNLLLSVAPSSLSLKTQSLPENQFKSAFEIEMNQYVTTREYQYFAFTGKPYSAENNHPYLNLIEKAGPETFIIRGNMQITKADAASGQAMQKQRRLNFSKLDVHVTELRAKNNFGDFEGQMRVTIDQTDGPKSGRFLYKTRSQYAEGAGEYYAHLLTFLVQSLYGENSVIKQYAADAALPFKAEDVTRFAKAIPLFLPAYHRLGEHQVHIDLQLAAPGAKEAMVKLNAFDIQTEPFSFLAKGQLKNPQEGGTATLRCIDCPAMLESLFLYARDINRGLAIIKKEKDGPLQLEDALLFDLQQFVDNISQDGAQPKEKVITIQGTGPQNLTISGQPFQMVMIQAMQRFMPYIQKLKKKESAQQ